MISRTQKETPAGRANGPRGDAVFYADTRHSSQTRPRPQLRRLNDCSAKVAFVEGSNGTDLGWLARGNCGWNAVRAGSGDAYAFPTALKAFRYLIGGRS